MKVGRILSKSITGVDAIDVELLLTKVLNITRANLKAYPERELSVEEHDQFSDLLQRRVKGEPVAYLVGHKEFWSLDFVITPDVLIPRADTELLVEIALEILEGRHNVRILDLGTGSGAIALSIASEMPDAMIIATDASAEALNIAQLNARQFHLANVEFALGNWFDALSAETNKTFDMIVSNPPYIAQYDPHLTQGDLRFEPNRALISGLEGMDDLSKIITQAPTYLNAGGYLLVEHGYNQEQLVAKEFALAGFSEINCYKDLSGIPRVTVGVV
jgi:release factor glutamine methyltransferase